MRQYGLILTALRIDPVADHHMIARWFVQEHTHLAVAVEQRQLNAVCHFRNSSHASTGTHTPATRSQPSAVTL